MEIKIKYLADVEKVSKINIGDWIDLRAAEDIKLAKGESALVSLGLAIQLPEGYEALLAPRSSTFKTFKVLQTNSIGVIDNSYLGEWKLPVIAAADTEIHKNDRICQFRILKNQPKVDIIEVSEFDKETERGTGGFGSTGR